MDIILLVLAGILMIIGLIGAFLPVVPGLPFSYVGILLLQWVYAPFSTGFLVTWAILIVTIMVLDNVIPVWSTKKWGGSDYGVNGSMIGMIFGLFFPPVGLIVGPLAGAFIGELIKTKKPEKALSSSIGAFAGFMLATGIKVFMAALLAWQYVWVLFKHL